MATNKTAARPANKNGVSDGMNKGDLAKSEGEVFDNSVELEQDTRNQVIDALNQLLGDTFDLMSQTKQAHWNVKGPRFIGLHELFDDLAEGLEKWIDEIAERAVAIGGYAKGTVRMAAGSSRIPEYPTDVVMDLDHVQALVERYAVLANNTRETIDQCDEAGDADSADLLTDVSRELDKWLWFLEAHLQAPGREAPTRGRR